MTLSRQIDFSSEDYNAKHFGKRFWRDLVEWINSDCSITEVFSEAEIAEYVHDSLEIDDVYDEDQLEEWALNNGYIRKEG